MKTELALQSAAIIMKNLRAYFFAARMISPSLLNCLSSLLPMRKKKNQKIYTVKFPHWLHLAPANTWQTYLMQDSAKHLSSKTLDDNA